ncbi:hypothetical protein B566_EDAN014918 [Ephemera danica]|nr:hypothetical protein B566_EDAN014918 [Ephemera danica]
MKTIVKQNRSEIEQLKRTNMELKTQLEAVDCRGRLKNLVFSGLSTRKKQSELRRLAHKAKECGYSDVKIRNTGLLLDGTFYIQNKLPQLLGTQPNNNAASPPDVFRSPAGSMNDTKSDLDDSSSSSSEEEEAEEGGAATRGLASTEQDGDQAPRGLRSGKKIAHSLIMKFSRPTSIYIEKIAINLAVEYLLLYINQLNQNYAGSAISSNVYVNKFHQFTTLIENYAFPIVFGTESWLDSSFLDNEIFPTYLNIYRKDRDKFGGGVFIAVHKSIKSELCWISDLFECLYVKINNTVNGANTFLIVAYRPPNNDFSILGELYDRTSTDQHVSKNFLIAGEINLPHVDWMAATDRGGDAQTRE